MCFRDSLSPSLLFWSGLFHRIHFFRLTSPGGKKLCGLEILTMATQDLPPSVTQALISSNNMINNENLFAKVSQRFGLLPGAKGLNEISQVIEEGTQTVGSGSPLDQVRREAEVIADDVILNFGKDDKKKAPSKFSKTMRRTVRELSSRHDIAFKGMVNKLNLDSNNPFQTFAHVADEIFDDGQINWGRIVAVYAFAARLAARETGKNDFPKKISLFVGKYVANKLGKWILDNGGWEAFAEYFPDQGEIEDTMWKGLLFTAVGLGALASVVATR